VAGFTAAAGVAADPASGPTSSLKAGEFCSTEYEIDYEEYGFSCVNGHLKGGPTATITLTATTSTTSEPQLGKTVLLKHRTRTCNRKKGARI